MLTPSGHNSAKRSGERTSKITSSGDDGGHDSLQLPTGSLLAITERKHMLGGHVPELNVLCAIFGSDKGRPAWWPLRSPYEWQPHNYTEVYGELFRELRWTARTIFECGIGSTDHSVPSNMGGKGRPGASLRVWKSFFPQARILGADIDRSVLIREPGIDTHYVDQTDPQSIEEMWAAFKVNDGVDVIFDDGLHTYQAGTSWQHLKPGGYYIIEDVLAKDTHNYGTFLAEQSARLLKGARFLLLHLPRNTLPGNEADDNRLIIIQKPSKS